MARILFAFLIVSTLAAQTAPQPGQVLQLSLKRAVEIAEEPNGSVRVRLAQESVQQSESLVAQSRAALLPNLDGSVTDENEVRNLEAFGIRFPSIPGITFPTIVGPFDVFDARATVTQSIFDFSSIRRYQASKVNVEAVKQEGNYTRDQVADQVARTYVAGMRAKAAWETAKANVDLSEALLRLAQSQKAAGTGTGIEITRAEVQLANDNQRLLVAETDRHRAYLQLLKAMGLKLDIPVELSDTLSETPAPATTVDQALAAARDSRADLKAQLKREEVARLSYSSVKSERLPSLVAFADYGSIGSSIDNASPTRTYGVQLKVPIFDGLPRRPAERKLLAIRAAAVAHEGPARSDRAGHSRGDGQPAIGAKPDPDRQAGAGAGAERAGASAAALSGRRDEQHRSHRRADAARPRARQPDSGALQLQSRPDRFGDGHGHHPAVRGGQAVTVRAIWNESRTRNRKEADVRKQL